jgi:O-acetyl-ADP-ribose deacetylase (regulator of RNase III)
MPINEVVQGDLIALAKNYEYEAIAHGCNCLCTMGSGIAPMIRQAFPAAWEADQFTVKGDRDKLGSYSVGYDEGHDMFVFNLYTQYDYFGRKQGRRDVDYNAVTSAFAAMNEWCRDNGISVIGIPKIGAGLAGGDWETIKERINAVTPDLDIELVEYNR